MKKTIYKNRKCPTHKNCWGYKDSSCNDCDYGNEFIRLHNKIDRLKKKLEKAEKSTADVVEVVRCRDCKLRNAYGCPVFCGGINLGDDDYCSFAERVEE